MTRYLVAAAGSVTVAAGPDPGTVVELGGARGGVRTLAAGETLAVVVTAVHALATRSSTPDGPWVLAPMIARHPLLGNSRAYRHHGDGGGLVAVTGPELTIAGAIALDADGDGRVRISAERHEAVIDPRAAAGEPVPAPPPPEPEPEPPLAEPDAPPAAPVAPPVLRERWLVISTGLAGRGDVDGLLRAGGPLVAAGSREGAFVLRAGYQLGLGEHAFLGVDVETDFDGLRESLVLDVATPEYAIIVPSLHVGAGVVASHLDPRGTDVGLRLRAGATELGLGGDADFDYWPARDEWTFTAVARIGL